MNLNLNNKSFSDLAPKINLRTLIVLLLFAIGLYFLVPKMLGLEETFKLMLKVNKFYLILALISEFVGYLGIAFLLGIILSRLGYKISLFDRFRLGSTSAFAVHFLPIGYFGQGALDFYLLTKKGVAGGSVLLMLVLKIIALYTAFLILFMFGLISVPASLDLPFSPRIISLLLFLVILWGVLYIFFLYRNKVKFRGLWFRFVFLINFFARLFRQAQIKKEKGEEVFEDVYQGIGLYGEKKRSSAFAILASLLYWLGDIICFLFVFLSFGYKIHFGALIFGYGVATLAGLISLIPGGLGVTEGFLALIFSSLGVPLSLALMSILVFRFFSFWIWIPIGFGSYLSLKKEINEIS